MELILSLLIGTLAVAGVWLLLRPRTFQVILGLALATAVILLYMAGGTRWAEARLGMQPLRWVGAGLLLAAATGAAALVLGHPFLTSHTRHIELPLLGSVALPSALAFDLGVFALVVGATALVLIALAHQSIRGHRAAPER